MNEVTGKKRSIWWIAALCFAGFVGGGFYGCKSAGRLIEPYGRDFMVAEYVQLTAGYMRGWCEDGEWPEASQLVFSDMEYVDTRQEPDGLRVDRFLTPYDDGLYWEVRLGDNGWLSTAFVSQ